MSEPHQHTVPIDAVAQKTAEQRNNAHDALARAEVFIEELLAENERLTAEVEKLRTDASPTVN